MRLPALCCVVTVSLAACGGQEEPTTRPRRQTLRTVPPVEDEPNETAPNETARPVENSARQDSEPAPPAEMFNCYKTPLYGNPERECGRSLFHCDIAGCTQQARAHCFYDVGHLNLSREPSPQWICVATNEECESWRADVTAKRKAGPCLSMTLAEMPADY